jgi:pantoate--beta-alanine ligase
MYPPGFQTWVDVTEVTKGLEGERRPGHFRGVATVVTKLFNLVQPMAAYFGQKDAQQTAVIKQFVRDLNFPMEIVVCPTVREADGLALSSRNVYLSPDQRKAAPILYQALMAAAGAYSKGERRPERLRAAAVEKLKEAPGAVIDYVAVTDAVTLREMDEQSKQPLLVSMVVRMGSTRLLDNVLLPVELNDRTGLTRVLGGATFLSGFSANS